MAKIGLITGMTSAAMRMNSVMKSLKKKRPEEAQLKEIRLQHDLVEAKLWEIRLKRDLEEAKIRESLQRDLEEENLRESRQRDQLEEAKLWEIRLQRDLEEAKLQEIRLQRDLEEAKLREIKLQHVLEEANLRESQKREQEEAKLREIRLQCDIEEEKLKKIRLQRDQLLELEQFSAEHSVCALFKKGSQTAEDKGKKPLVEDSFLHESPMNKGFKPHYMPLHYLKEITNNFSDKQILGRGGFGVVYKGVLHNGETIAVKKLLQSVSISHEQFEKEVGLLVKLDHPNIVRLVGYCYETQHLHIPHEGKSVFAETTEVLLCLECLPNGSLDKYISGASSGLDWHTRYKIIEGISYGLQYLHEQSNGPVIHLDLKPANILLDKNMQPKIIDFGLSRLFDQNKTIHTTTTCGTPGYISPEYLVRGIITPMSDIFSLGVIIMEVITGHRDYPYDISTSSQDYFIETELQKWRNKFQEQLVHASLEPDSQQIRRCIEIGLMCVNPERTERPTMKQVIGMLRG